MYTGDEGKRFVVRSDEMLSAFLELERINASIGGFRAPWG